MALDGFEIVFLAAFVGAREAWHPNVFERKDERVYGQVACGQIGDIVSNQYHAQGMDVRLRGPENCEVIYV